MKPGSYNHRFVAGDDYSVTITLRQGGVLVDTSGYVFRAEIRNQFLPTGALLGSFSVSPVVGGCVLSLTAEQTRALGAHSRLVWDLQSESPEVRTWLSGSVVPLPEVTND